MKRWCFGKSYSLEVDETGVTIIEMIVTLLLAAIVFSSFALILITMNNIVVKGKYIILTDDLAFSKLQDYENTEFDSIPTSTSYNSAQQVEDFTGSLPTFLPSPHSGTVHITSVSSTLKQVTVKISYAEGSASKLMEYSSLIQKNGVGR